MARYLLCDVGSTFTKLCLVDAAAGEVLATSTAATTIEPDVNLGLDEALAALGCDAGDLKATLVCSSAAGGLRIVAVGLVPELTLEAGRMAALGAGGRIVGAFGFRLTDDDLAELRAAQPDLILLSGGTDGGDMRHILHNARVIRDACEGVPLVVAGNRAAATPLRKLLAGRPDVHFTENVLPRLGQLNLEPARQTIRQVFLERIVLAKGLDRLHARARVLMPTPEAVLQAATLASTGAGDEPGKGELIIVDIGGATTDVYSCAAGRPRDPQAVYRGLPEPFAKRTVEADVGMRHTLAALLAQVDAEALASEAGATTSQLEAWATAVRTAPSRLPQDDAESRLDAALARAACRLAVRRHAGRLTEAYTPQGRIFVQEGKDLTGVATVIGSGGPLARTPRAAEILDAVCRHGDAEHLLPQTCNFYVDRQYILWAAGLLAQEEPAAALAILRKCLVPLGATCPGGGA